MKYNSAFEIIGPVMVGPSSSHTAGAVRIGRLARAVLAEQPTHVRFELMGSFLATYRGHGTDVALLAGVLGMSTDDAQVPNALEVAKESGLVYEFAAANLGHYHPNTVRITLSGKSKTICMVASSLGGGKVEVQELDGLPVKFTGERSTFILYHVDEQGFLARMSRWLDERGINIARLSLERWQKGGDAITVCEVDTPVCARLTRDLFAAIPTLRDICIIDEL
ncbi:MAG: L-serine ammonia-lyase, iron-sulfur-dependent subunit beta [Alicyclobacillus herbarius]|uniref:L-serine ammonia-lyase, iron-sulfur-dependent subunit beta n=1 Tax=Alicyclobacillus herbarius TaxID=122960 RepID=UPI0003FC2C93|nr:L-serine ammonia-lyase, iron-sulfur-dependent subunit beta [Alicyclobacillus herbarius]MCL6631482.1 L-serine ammonia-lyase, iron-sulfur-dependent subunit beta [Alicyclobacillus herbarius]